MADLLPVLIFPRPEPVKRPVRQYGGGGASVPPDRQKQGERIEQQLEKARAVFVSEEVGDVERVLVMETTSRIEGLQKAAQKIEGLECLAEFDVDDIELHDLYDEKTKQKVKGGRFYLLSSNKQATDRLLRLWRQSRKGKLERGLGKFKEVFEYLITLREWNLEDRLRDTGILEKWKEEWEDKKGTTSDISFEIELHYRRDETKGGEKFKEIKKIIEGMGGEVGQVIRREEIAFHALKAKIPVRGIESVMGQDWNTGGSDGAPSTVFHRIFNKTSIKYFRPIGQQIEAEGELLEQPLDRTAPPNDKPPVLALLDGAPMLRHNQLDGRIHFYDPDSYEESYEPSQRRHGTAMASLICHGDLSQLGSGLKSLPRRIYARPVMKPHPDLKCEVIPPDRFAEDIIERAVREMFEGESPEAPDVRVINLSLGNIDQHYLHEMSPWARLLDWLSFKYKVLFIVSAGNFTDSIQLADPVNAQRPLSGDMDSRRRLLSGIDHNARNHRLLSPAESMNALTVGALQRDSSGLLPAGIRGSDPIDDRGLPAPYSRIGPGYRGAIKPEIFAPGGRLLYDANPHNENCLEPVSSNLPPGIRVASPLAAMPEQLENSSYQAGTSHAAAIASHGAGHIYEMLDELRKEHADILLSKEYDAVLIKTLLVHSASQGENGKAYEHLQKSTQKFKRYLSKYVGYGNIDIERVLECTRARATAVGCSKINATERHRFSFPLPEDSPTTESLQLILTVTLAWFSPINPFDIRRRRAKLSFEGPSLKGRQESDWQQVRKGTVQHEIFEFERSKLLENNLEIFVDCAADAGELDDEIPYGMAITLEAAKPVAESVADQIDLYQVVKKRIKQPQPVGVSRE